jgi:hypothetical protein
MTLASLTFVSCGKKSENAVSSTVGEATGTNDISTNDWINFAGDYFILPEASNLNCQASIQIVSECNGLLLLSSEIGPEEFCNINQVPSRNPREGDRDNRRPPNIDVKNEMAIVTQIGNEIKSVLRINERLFYTNTITLNTNGVLTKISNLKSRTSRCNYLKR